MRGLEKVFVLWALGYTVVYSCLFVSAAIAQSERAIVALLPFHFLGMVQNVIAFILTIRDLYKRPFPNPNSKVTWTLLILCTGGIGWVVYIFRYALKPRPDAATPSGAPTTQSSAVES